MTSARLLSILLIAAAAPVTLVAQAPAPPATAAVGGLTYADLADLADRADVVARIQVRKVVRLEPERAVAASPGMVRVYVEGRTKALLIGRALPESVRYLVDLPLDARGRLPRLNRTEVLVFARSVPGRPGELQLTTPDAQLRWSPELEARTSALLREMIAPGAAPPVLRVREAMHVRGNLMGEGETQIFLDTATGDPISISVVRRPGAPRAWGVSLDEIVDQTSGPPQRDTLTWYRLACFLPPQPSQQALGGDPAAQTLAAEDYAYVRGQLGDCPRTRPPRERR